MKTRSAILFYTFITLWSISFGLLMLAIPWHYTGQNQFSYFQIIYAITTASSLFIGYPMGTLLDTYNRKHILLYFYTPLALILFIPTIVGQENYLIILIFVLQFWGYILFYPAVYSMIKESFHPRKYLLTITLVEFIGQFTVALAASVSVLLLDGMKETFSIMDIQFDLVFESLPIEKVSLLAGILLSASLIPLSLIKYKKRTNRKNIETFWDNFSDGFKYMVTKRKLFLILLFSYFIFIVLIIERVGLLSKYVNNILGESAIVFSNSEIYYTAGGTIISILIIIVILFFSQKLWKKVKSKEFLYVISLSIFIVALLFLITTVSNNIVIFYIVSFGFGFFNSLSRILREVYIFYAIPNKYFARTGTLLNMATTIIRMTFILIFSIPFFYKDTNISYAHLILGIFTLLGALALFFIVRNKKETADYANTKINS